MCDNHYEVKEKVFVRGIANRDFMCYCLWL